MSIYCLPVRVYYQDTDAGGVVFHANYLKFMERARTEWMRDCFNQTFTQLQHDFSVLFVIRSLKLDYLRPARLDDLLSVTVRLQHIGHSRITVLQEILHNEEQLAQAEIHIVCIDVDSFKPVAIPEALKNQWQLVLENI